MPKDVDTSLRLPSGATRRFDALSGMLYVEYSYEATPAELFDPTYDTTDLASRFLSLVKGEATAEAPPVSPRTDYPRRYLESDSINDEVIRQSEHLVLSGALDEILLDQSSEPASRLWTLFQSSILGNPDNRRQRMPSWLSQRVDEQRRRALPLTFVLLAFPFKDQNPFRTVLRPWEIDLGEMVFLGRLAALSLAAWRVHPYGARWVILSDATLYAPVFRISPEDAERYLAAVASAIRRHNLDGLVQVVDMRKEGEAPLSSAGIDFDDLVARVSRDLRALIERDVAEDIGLAYSALVRGQVQGLNLRPYLDRYAPEDVWHAVYRRGAWWKDPDAKARNPELESEIHEQAREVAVAYAATNIAVGLVGMAEYLVPGGLRTTVHAKPEQLAVPRLGRSYPWNGTAVLSGHLDGENEAFSMEVRDVGDVIDKGYHGAILPGHERPWYFTKD